MNYENSRKQPRSAPGRNVYTVITVTKSTFNAAWRRARVDSVLSLFSNLWIIRPRLPEAVCQETVGTSQAFLRLNLREESNGKRIPRAILHGFLGI